MLQLDTLADSGGAPMNRCSPGSASAVGAVTGAGVRRVGGIVGVMDGLAVGAVVDAVRKYAYKHERELNI